MAKNWGPWTNLGASGEGGQAHIFKVQHSTDGRLGALKRIKNPKRIDRFKKEIEAAEALDHPNIAKLLDADDSLEPQYVVFEWEEGGTLADIEPADLSMISIDDRLAWCEQVARALALAHKNEVVHRDVKPENILVSTDRSTTRLCDFGLVYFAEGERITATIEQVGSRFYIAPECEDGRADEITPATDLYSLGKLLYYVASGGRIFARERQRAGDNDLKAITANPFMEHVAALVDRLVVDDQQRRIQSADEVVHLLAAARRGVRDRLPCKGVPSTYRCVFCGEGIYKFITSSRGEGHNKGYPNEGNISNEYLAYYECPICGNSQRFKLKYAPQWFPELDPKELKPNQFQLRDGMVIKTA